MKRKWLMVILVISLIGSTALLYAVKEYNRLPASMAETKEDRVVTAREIIQAYDANATKADSLFLGKTLLVKGLVAAIDSAGESNITIILRSGESGTGIRCSLDSGLAGKGMPVKENDSIELRGICTGFIADELGLGSDIIINKTFITKKIQ